MMAEVAEHYRTYRGSVVEVRGQHRGIINIVFDWVEEGACVEAGRRVEADVRDPTDAWLRWECGCHGQHQAKLEACDAGAR